MLSGQVCIVPGLPLSTVWEGTQCLVVQIPCFLELGRALPVSPNTQLEHSDTMVACSP